MNIITKSLITFSLVVGLAVVPSGLRAEAGPPPRPSPGHHPIPGQNTVSSSSTSLPTKEQAVGISKDLKTAQGELNAYKNSAQGKADMKKDKDVKKGVTILEKDLKQAVIIADKIAAGKTLSDKEKKQGTQLATKLAKVQEQFNKPAPTPTPEDPRYISRDNRHLNPKES